ncbi:MAG: PIN domain-containing protein [Gemmatimonadota bacterium]
MRVAYLDTSCLVAVAFEEPRGPELAARLDQYQELIASNLLEAEFRSTLHREGVDGAQGFLERVAWLLPDRPLGGEMERVLRVRYLRGADLWHVAAALYLADTPENVDFLTLDDEQGEAAAALGFGTLG